MNERNGNNGGSVEVKSMTDTVDVTDMVTTSAGRLDICFTKERIESNIKPAKSRFIW